MTTLTPSERAELLSLCQSVLMGHYPIHSGGFVKDAQTVARALKSLLTQAPGDERVEAIRKRHEGDVRFTIINGYLPAYRRKSAGQACFDDRAYLLSLFAAAPTLQEDTPAATSVSTPATDGTSGEQQPLSPVGEAPRVDAGRWKPKAVHLRVLENAENLAHEHKFHDLADQIAAAHTFFSEATPPSPSPTPAPTKGEVMRQPLPEMDITRRLFDTLTGVLAEATAFARNHNLDRYHPLSVQLQSAFSEFPELAERAALLRDKGLVK